ncbi:catechol 2,3-dioxygenase-like lactoylglutathione lyase family enzyme [Erwinia persicina]|jgi:catechol 2,3-dioxygenase-like lactoylglutathione lyase family enzyme|uniref:VOC family protein n=2 Tax=Erwinia TaxID=551 RepID=A0ABV4EE56_9GAMM|nr:MULTISPECIES: VOC family protein [Erwinia]MCP1440866.1 catechol 2,3-dioxygenase-like lactoylglutathione lyase family enzyme [Erwinia persicina]MDN4629020.1 VOC family protein [Erwinia sp. PsM31]MDN8543911.1 VOC family protein [Erwinia sp. BC051422]
MSTGTVRGMDHVGITVSDIEEATRFFSEAFGAEVIYDSVSPSDDDVKGEETESILNLFPGTRITTVRMMKLQHGPGLELFEMQGPEQHQPVRPSDYGIQHFAVYVDDINEAIGLFERAGGKMFTSPQPLMFPTEAGDNNFFCYGRTPWGSVIELISLPSRLPYEESTSLRRWKP